MRKAYSLYSSRISGQCQLPNFLRILIVALVIRCVCRSTHIEYTRAYEYILVSDFRLLLRIILSCCRNGVAFESKCRRTPHHATAMTTTTVATVTSRDLIVATKVTRSLGQDDSKEYARAANGDSKDLTKSSFIRFAPEFIAGAAFARVRQAFAKFAFDGLLAACWASA